jgi:PDZ domain-containing secreted protein
MNKIFYAISWVTIILALFLLLVISYWTLFPKTPIEFEPVHKVINKKVESGDYLAYTVKYCKYLDISPLVSKAFVDGIVYEIPQAVYEAYKPGCGEVEVMLYVPRNLPPGEYYIQTTHRYQVNPIQTVDIVTRTEQFKVIE